MASYSKSREIALRSFWRDQPLTFELIRNLKVGKSIIYKTLRILLPATVVRKTACHLAEALINSQYFSCLDQKPLSESYVLFIQILTLG
jgi:hypothetical protein